MEQNTVYQFIAKLPGGRELPLSDFKGKVLLVVNTASACGFTVQLKELQQLYSEFRAQGLEILAFPSNDFGRQEPLDGEQIGQFCQVNYGVTFRVFDKIRVKGSQPHPLFKFLRNKKSNGRVSSTPRWNFHKYLINRQGEVVDYFYPFTKPSAKRLKNKIKALL